MKRLALLLGSLLVVSAAASAKEVVPAPVVVEEAPVQIVEKEVIVYRDKEEGFRPNGYVDLQYRWYGDTEGQNHDFDATSPRATGNDAWNTANNYSRTQLITKINMTENQALEARIRNYNNLDKETTAADELTGAVGDDRTSMGGTQVRLRYFYDHGLVGDSKVDLTSRLEYRDNGDDDDSQYVEYQAQFNFADYLFNNDFVKTTNFQVAPKYRYAWGADNSSDYDNQVGVDLYTMHEFPLGFSFELNLYATQHFYGQDQSFDGGSKLEDKNFTVDMEAYIYNTTNLYTNGNYSVDFGFEGGYDAYQWSQEKKFGTKVAATDMVAGAKAAGTQNAKYSLYALPYIQLSYQATEFTTIYAAAGAEYRDWAINSQNSASNWRWQPTAWAGFKTTF